MKKFILLYIGPVTPLEQMTKEQTDKVNLGWKNWMERVDGAVVDMGAPMTGGRALVDDGSVGSVALINGYTIIQADDMDNALKLIEDHPFLSEKAGKFSIEIFELVPIPEM